MAEENLGLDLASQTGQENIVEAIEGLNDGQNGSGLANQSGQEAIKESIENFSNDIIDVLNDILLAIAPQGTPKASIPTGSVIFYAGLTAPEGFLHCNGTIYNILDYPDLASFIEDNYGSLNYFGGDGTTTFAVPDWRGEFFRAAGTNSRSGQGSGGSVGEHQDQTMHVRLAANKNENVGQLQGNTSGWLSSSNEDALETSNSHYWMNISSGNSGLDSSATQRYASRPTNTSLLVCIKT